MNIAVILAGGTGSRVGTDIPKQYIEVCGKPVIGYCLDKIAACGAVDAVQIVAEAGWHDYIRNWMEKDLTCTESGLTEKWRGFSEPGENRQLSVYHGLTDILRYASADDYVMIHDAARPQVSPAFLTKCFEMARGHDGVLPVLPMKDTVYLSQDGACVTDLLDRSKVYAGQAPEVFRIGRYYEANRKLLPERILAINGSTEPAILAHMDVAMIPGDEENFKITTKADLERFRRMMEDAGYK